MGTTKCDDTDKLERLGLRVDLKNLNLYYSCALAVRAYAYAYHEVFLASVCVRRDCVKYDVLRILLISGV